MATFNPDQNPTNPDFTADSKGMSAKNSAGDLFGNVGNLGVSAVKIADQNNTQNITQEVETEVDRLNNEWGTSASAFETSVNSKNIQPLPGDLQRYGKQLGDVRKAYLNGSLKDSHYQMRIDSLSRQIRARYPGYRQEIDSIIGRTLQQSTANDLRRTLMAEWNSEAAKMDDNDKRFAQEVTQARKDGALPPDWDRRNASGNPYSQAETRMYMASRYQIDADMDRSRKSLELVDKQSEAGKKAVFEHGQREMALIAQRSFEGAFSIGGATIGQIQEKATAGLIKPWSDQQREEILAGFATFKTKFEAQIANRLSQPEYANLSDQQRKDLKSQAMAQVDIVQEALINQNFGMVNFAKQVNDTTIQEDLRKLNKDPIFRMKNNMKQFPDGQLIIDDILAKHPAMASKFNDTLVNFMTGEIFAPDVASADQLLKETKAKIGDLPPEVIKQNVHDAAQALLKKDASIEIASKAASFLFSEENQAFLGNFTTKSQDILFKTLISPRMTERMIELGKTDPQMLENYRNWTLNAFGALFNQDFNTLVDNNKFGDDLIIKWDAGKGEFRAEANPDSFRRGAMTPALGQMYKAWANSSANQSMQRLNDYVKRLKPILENEGGTSEEALTALFERFGINDVQNQGSLFFRLYESMAKGSPANQTPNRGEAYKKSINETPAELNDIDLEQTGSGKMRRSVNPDRSDYNMDDARDYIQEAAVARGIDPQVALRVAKSEGLQRGTWQSKVIGGDRDIQEPSYGPFQLLKGGGDTGFAEGLGNRFEAETGLDPADPKNWKAAIDFALDVASEEGWGAWYGARKIGIKGMMGIKPKK